MAEWRNWSGKVTAHPARVVAPRDEDEVVAAVRAAADDGLPVRAVGAAHSHSPLAATDGVALCMDGVAGVVDADPAAGEATVWAGSRIFALGEPLRACGLALKNQGDIDQQAIAGAVATATHGTGRTLQNLSASVVGVRLVLGDGTVLDCDATTETHVFHAARVSLGALGIVTRLRLTLRPAYRLHERLWREDAEACLDALPERVAAARHFEFFWYPHRDWAACKSLDETEAEPDELPDRPDERIGWSDRIYPSVRDQLHTEMEYAVPVEHGPECFRAVRDLVHRDFPDLRWPLEYRTVAADALWISPHSGGDKVTISVHQAVELDDQRLFRACEEVFRSYGGRPHWGKVHFLDGDDLAASYPSFARWWSVRDHLDPKERFLNDHLRSLRPR